MSRRKKLNLAKFFDDFALAGRGLLLATRRKAFWPPFIITFLIFGLLLNLLANGFASFQLMFHASFLGALKILSAAFLAIFGVGKSFTDWLLNFALTLFQSILIALVIFVAKRTRATNSGKSPDNRGKSPAQPSSVATSAASKTTSVVQAAASSGLESSALVAGLAVLGSGCPTCGTTLLAPVLGTLLSGVSGGVALAGKLSLALNFLALLLATLVFRKLGVATYAIIKSEDFAQRRATQSVASSADRPKSQSHQPKSKESKSS